MENQSSKFLACWLALICALSFLLFSCDDQDRQTTAADLLNSPLYEWGKIKNQTLILWGNKNDLDRPFMQRAFARYQSMTGNHLKIEAFSHKELEEKLLKGFNGQGRLPDIFLFPGGSSLMAMNPDKNFHDFTKAHWVDDLTDTALSQTICNGRVIGLPHWEASIAGIIYNQKLFADLDIPIPRTLAEFDAVCAKLLENGVYPMYLPFTEPTMLLYQFAMNSMLQDDAILDGLNDNSLAYSDLPGMKRIVEWYGKMAERGYFGPNYEKQGWDGMDEAMKSGRYAMMLCWDTWLYSDFSGDPDNFGLMPAFVGEAEEGSFEGPNLMLLIVNENSPKRDAAIDFITFLADPYNYNAAFAGFHTAPVFKKQTGSLTTPQYDAAVRNIEKLLNESLARPFIQGFAQGDAIYIERYMRDPSYSVEACLKDMDKARLKRRAAKNSL